MQKSILFAIFFFYLSLCSFAQNKNYHVTRISSSIKIDGDLDDEAWKNLPVATDFIESDPVEGAKVSFPSEVKLAYDNTAIYIGAMFFDSAPDSIYHEQGNRDDGDGLRADNIRVGFDTYNTQQDAYVFNVTASGVQSDIRFSDQTYNAVWQSATKIRKDGWSIEIKIPYSAIRFPSVSPQTWGLQITRYISRYREFEQWALTPKKESNALRFWGKLEGLENIKVPLRLSLTPYVSVIYDQSPELNDDGTVVHDENGKVRFDKGHSFSGGADLKYGVDERFTLDMTLLPDFTQVKSDNKVKNLSAFETVYDENRPFFKEGTELFTKGNLFYSRRIGGTPSLFYSLPGYLNPGEVVVSNPSVARLINATKFSGRTNKKLGIGILNAVTGNTYATVRDTLGNEREILTEPLTNFNIFVLDQQLKNNGDVYVINSNTMREGSAADANVAGAGFSFDDKKNKYQASGFYSNSYRRANISDDSGTHPESISGNYYRVNLNKISGEFQPNIFQEYADKNYSRNDLGQLFYHDFMSTGFNLNYNKFQKFWKVIKEAYNDVGMNYLTKPSTGQFINASTWLNSFWLFTNYFAVAFNGSTNFTEYRDEYEPRYEGRFFMIPKNWNASLYLSTNYNKSAYIDFGGHENHTNTFGTDAYGIFLAPTFRLSDRLLVKLSYNWDISNSEVGFANFDSLSNDIFGSRDIQTITNALNARYLFKNDMSLSIIARHYWSRGEYTKYFTLLDNGSLETNRDYTGNNNFNSNYFNVDVVYSWQFSPGSSFILTVKNAIAHDEAAVPSYNLPSDYSSNLDRAFNYPRTTTVALKVLYYLDYSYLKKRGG